MKDRIILVPLTDRELKCLIDDYEIYKDRMYPLTTLFTINCFKNCLEGKEGFNQEEMMVMKNGINAMRSAQTKYYITEEQRDKKISFFNLIQEKLKRYIESDV